MSVRHFIDLSDFTKEDLLSILKESSQRKVARQGQSKGALDEDAPLKGKRLALIFAHPSTRTRISFEMAMHQLGGSVMTLSHNEMQIGRGETIEDTARVLSRYVDAVMIRMTDHDALKVFAHYSTASVINGLTEFSHPCQILADLLTLQEKWGSFENKTILWLGDGNNVCQSWIHAATLLGITFKLACPQGYEPEAKVLTWAKERGGDIHISHTLSSVLEGVDCVMTDTWVSMGQKESEARLFDLSPYQVTEKVMKQVKKDAVFMHCLPAHRGEEVEANVIDGSQSLVFDQAENRLHVQKGVLLWCLK
jgi:ornithine carbamoyltransferase